MSAGERDMTLTDARPESVAEASGETAAFAGAAVARGFAVGRPWLAPRLTVGNCFLLGVVIMGLVIAVFRFTFGLGSVTALDDNTPWGLWIGFDLMCGVVLGAGRYATSTAGYHLMGLKHFYPLVRPSLASAFLGYFFVVVALTLDMGQPWRMPFPLLFSQGATSVLFESALCVCLYLVVLTVQISPEMGFNLILPIFAAAILGGVGSIYGAVLGGLFIGLAESLSVPLIGAAYKPAVGFLLMFLILLCYPRGLLGERT